jgi:hypothetical protein
MGDMPWLFALIPAETRTLPSQARETTQNIFQKVGVFFPPQNHHTTHHVFTTQKPRSVHNKTTIFARKSQNPTQKHPKKNKP